MKKYNITIRDLFLYDWEVIIAWSEPTLGFGEVTITKNPDGSFEVDSECMGKEFVEELFSAVKKFIFNFF